MDRKEVYMKKILIRKISITEVETEAIVNAANEQLLQGGGVCGAIFAAAGPEKLRKACERYDGCATGDAVITPGFDLCEYIIHAVGPIYLNGLNGEDRMLYDCYRHSLDLARENGITSIAFPLISSGIYGYPAKGAWEVALKSCSDWLKRNAGYDIEIVFAIISDELCMTGERIAAQLGIETGDDDEL